MNTSKPNWFSIFEYPGSVSQSSAQCETIVGGGSRFSAAHRIDRIRVHCEAAMAVLAAALTRFRIRLQRRNQALMERIMSENNGPLSHAQKCRAGNLKWQGKPAGIPPAMAIEFLVLLKAGSTIRKLTGGGVLGPAMVSYDRFKEHCTMHPDWAVEAHKISERNGNIGKGARLAKRTHCANGHAFAEHGRSCHTTAGIFVNAESAKRYGMIAAE